MMVIMTNWYFYCFVITISIGLIVHVFNKISVVNLTELDSCPYCYGEDYCSELHSEVSLRFQCFSDVVFNLISVKNVYFASKGKSDMVLVKKLTGNENFRQLDLLISNRHSQVIKQDLLNIFSEKYRNFHICDHLTTNLFLNHFSRKNLTHLWTIIEVNAEPLLLELFKKEHNWPVPKLLGYCGRTITVENCGLPLNNFENSHWYDRAYIAVQLLEAAGKFSTGHEYFRLYLTDVSSDNIVVHPETLRIAFVDLEHAILQKKVIEAVTYHYSEHLNDEEYGFSTEKICGCSISDHNIYSVCRLLLSPFAPWPMMHNGLLHSPPSTLDTTSLFQQIELCVYNHDRTSRFFHGEEIIRILNKALTVS